MKHFIIKITHWWFCQTSKTHTQLWVWNLFSPSGFCHSHTSLQSPRSKHPRSSSAHCTACLSLHWLPLQYGESHSHYTPADTHRADIISQTNRFSDIRVIKLQRKSIPWQPQSYWYYSMCTHTIKAYYSFLEHRHFTWWVTNECNLTSALSLTSFQTSSPYDSLMKSWRLSHSSPYIMSPWIETQTEHCQDSSPTDWLPAVFPKAPASK